MMDLFFALTFFSLFKLLDSESFDDDIVHCTEVYDEKYNCPQPDTSSWHLSCFQTPWRGGTQDPPYKDSYQDMHLLVGYAQLQYSSNREKCTVSIYTRTHPKKIQIGNNHKLLYFFENEKRYSDSKDFYKATDKYEYGLNITVKVVEMNNEANVVATLKLEEIYFIWNVPEVKYDDPEYNKNGQQGVIVELFGWPYEDIVEEADFLKLSGYLGVKITPPNEHVWTNDWIESNGLNPWEYILQPVSYKLKSRLGDKKDLKDMIYKCREKGIRVYSQVIINHMTHQGNDIYNDHYNANDCQKNNNWPGKSSTAGSPYFTVRGRHEEIDILNLEDSMKSQFLNILQFLIVALTSIVGKKIIKERVYILTG